MNTNISVVVPVYNEEEVLPEFHRQLSAVLEKIDPNFEIIFVDDASADKTPDILKTLNAGDPRVKSIRFSRNFGHQIAFAAGLKAASGRAAVTMDGDLQHPPAIIAQLVAKWREGYDVVCTVRQNTEGAGFLKDAAVRFAYRMINSLGGIRLEIGAADFRLINRKALDCLTKFEERRRFLRGLIVWMGFRQISIPYQAAPRAAGEAKYNFWSLLNLALDGMLSFSYYPLRLATIFGAMVSLLGFIYACFAVYAHFFNHRSPTGWASLLISVLILGGLQLLFLGLLGEYIGRTYDEVKRRPLYIVESKIGLKQ
ncbi:MAG: glycosyltransferase family 2 protein [Elusimicrobia bacterium]|nr:glycosyltransferase family 2 protein [Elusimicrobiota bacterium]